MRRDSCWLLAVCLAASCNTSQPTIEILVHGPAYPRPRCARGELQRGKLYMRGKPIAGATLRLDPGADRLKTNARGVAKLGSQHERKPNMTLSVSAPGFRPLARRALRPDQQNRVELTLYPCVGAGKDRYAVGFDRPVALAARNRCGKRWRKGVRYQWRQLEGRDVKDNVKRWTGPKLVFRTHPMQTFKKLPPTPQLMSFSHEEAGEYVFELTATNRFGERSVSTVLVNATSVVNGMTSVAPYKTYIFAGEPKGPWKWKVARKPKDWRVRIRGAETRTPAITPIPRSRALGPPAVVELANEKTGLRFSIVIGDWNVVRRDCGRSECHHSMQRYWEKTLHGQSWKRLIDGELVVKRGAIAESCADCHAVGYHRRYDIGGYDDVAKRQKQPMPLTARKGNYAALPAALKAVSNVYCLGCHGPSRLDPPVAEQPGLFGVGVCARCHDRLPELKNVAEWRQSKHSQTITIDINGPDKRKDCARCHTAQGYVYDRHAIARPHSSKTAVLTCCETTQPVTCQACHDPMRQTQHKQIRRFGATKTASGLRLDTAGAAALCISCHNARHALDEQTTLAERLAPHAPQAELTYGKAGYALSVKGHSQELPALSGVTCASKTRHGCVTCHMHEGPKKGNVGHLKVGGHTFKTSVKDANGKPLFENTAACQKCHKGRRAFDETAKADYDGDGKRSAQRSEVRGLLALLEKSLRARIEKRAYIGCASDKPRGVWFKRGSREKIVVVDSKGKDLGDCDGSGVIERREQPFVFPRADLLLHKAAYNYLVIVRDRSFGLHNYNYAVKLLQRTILALGTPPNKWKLMR
jgi:hypothetical protein